MSSNLWTDTRVDTLRELWHEGFSARQIAGRIGGISRNAVIGKIYRLGLSQKQMRVIKDPLTATDDKSEEYDMCQWPLGHPDEENFHFCGASVVSERPYCANHCAVAYRQNYHQESAA